MRFKYLFAMMAVGAVALAACGSSSHSSIGAQHASTGSVAVTSSGVAVQTGDTALGTVLVSSSGMTLYARTPDTKTNSSCIGACAQVWPPVHADKGWTVAKGLDRSLFGTLVRADGTRQLVAGQWPLYTYAGDSKPGDVNGEGSGGIWFAVGANGKLVKSAPTATTTMASSGY